MVRVRREDCARRVSVGRMDGTRRTGLRTGRGGRRSSASLNGVEGGSEQGGEHALVAEWDQRAPTRATRFATRPGS